MAGRYAPSPTGLLHLGNLRTALIAWLAARSTNRRFYVRVEDLDQTVSSREYETAQLRDMAALGLDWDQPVVRQSERFDLYRSVIDQLDAAGLVYRCYCTRREIREQIERSTQAPHTAEPDGAYPGTCRELTIRQRSELETAGRIPALRLRNDTKHYRVDDRIAGTYVGTVDDFVLARADGTPAYNLAVVVDDHLQEVDQVVRGDDLLSSTPRHLKLYDLLQWKSPEYWHVPLVMDGDVRLAKRTGSMTMQYLVEHGVAPADILGALAHTLGLAPAASLAQASELIEHFDPNLIPPDPLQVADLGVDKRSGQ